MEKLEPLDSIVEAIVQAEASIFREWIAGCEDKDLRVFLQCGKWKLDFYSGFQDFVRVRNKIEVDFGRHPLQEEWARAGYYCMPEDFCYGLY